MLTLEQSFWGHPAHLSPATDSVNLFLLGLGELVKQPCSSLRKASQAA